MSRENDIKNLIVVNYRHLQKLKEQAAKFGIHTPPFILTEIEDKETEIEKLQKELANLAEQLDKASIPTIISDSAQKKKNPPLNVMVTGGRKTTPQVIELAFLIGQQVILKNHNLISNGAAGVDTASSEGALAVCRSKNLDPSVKIQVFRPRKAPTPHFEFGNLQIVGTDYDERRNFVVHKSDVVILLGGDKGTRNVARQAQIAGKPIIPLGIGAYDEAAVKLWYKIREQYIRVYSQ